MPHPALSPLDQAIAALTCSHIDVLDCATGVHTEDDAVPLLDRSIAQSLLCIESALSGKGKTILSKLASSIDEAIVLVEEARQLLQREAGDGAR